MAQRDTILLIGGTSEARTVAQALGAENTLLRTLLPVSGRFPTAYDVIAPSHMAAQVRGCAAVIDAGHGFEGEASNRIAARAKETAVPYLRLLRAPWTGHREVAQVREAMAHFPPDARVFSATGWPSLPDYAGFAGARLFLRQTERHERPAGFDFVECVFGTPPFPVEAEIDLFRRLDITHLICRNLGGTRSATKLTAAEALGIDITLVSRPAPPEGALVVQTADAALAWARQRMRTQ